MRFYRKSMSVDAVPISMDMSLGAQQGSVGDYIVTFDDGSQCIYESDLFHAEFELTPPTTPSRPAEVAHITTPQPPSPGKPWIPAPETSTECTCIDCGQVVKQTDWDPSSGLGRCCIRVKCLSCGTATKMKDIAGQYCPSCLPALAGRDRG